MKKSFIITMMVCICDLVVQSQTIYVDSDIGDDKNPGTKESPFYSIHKAAEIIKNNNNDIYIVKINPGIHILESPVSITTEKEMTGKRIIIEASILPDDTSWTPEQMPVIVNKSKKGKIDYSDQIIAGFLVEESHVTFRGIKFYGYFYPNSYYFPILRYNKEKTDLSVEQCMFVGDHQASHIQVGIIAHGNEIKVDYLHVIPNSPGYDIGAGLFKQDKTLKR